jgi:hypothetical protein
MSKVVRKVWLAASLLLLCAAGSCYVGEWNYQAEDKQLIKWWGASGFHISHAYPDTNTWQVLGGVLFFASAAVAVASLLLWRRDGN